MYTYVCTYTPTGVGMYLYGEGASGRFTYFGMQLAWEIIDRRGAERLGGPAWGIANQWRDGASRRHTRKQVYMVDDDDSGWM